MLSKPGFNFTLGPIVQDIFRAKVGVSIDKITWKRIFMRLYLRISLSYTPQISHTYRTESRLSKSGFKFTLGLIVQEIFRAKVGVSVDKIT